LRLDKRNVFHSGSITVVMLYIYVTSHEIKCLYFYLYVIAKS